jgi:hypothetical protein
MRTTVDHNRITVDRIRIVIRWNIVGWIADRGIINRWIAIVCTCRYIYWARIISKTKIETRLVIPGIVGIKINVTRMINRRYVYVLSYYYIFWHIFIFINCLIKFLRILIVFFVNLFFTNISQTGIATGQTYNQNQENYAME